MDNYTRIYKDIEEQEKLLQFDEFTNETALSIGLMLIEKAKQEKKSIAIDITRNGHQIFHYSFDNTSPDNDYWIAGKIRLVNRMFTSSLKYETLVQQTGKPLGEIIHSNEHSFLPGGGCFPIIIRNAGVVGTITVSGLSGYEDHMMVVDVLKKYLEVQ